MKQPIKAEVDDARARGWDPANAETGSVFRQMELEEVDAMAKGRLQQVGPKGERSSTARLKATDIPAIRSDPRDNILIAPEYGVSDVTIGNVKRRKTWNHIP